MLLPGKSTLLHVRNHCPKKLIDLRELGGDALVCHILAAFLENFPTLVAQAWAALGAGDADKIHSCVHTLKGSALSLGLTEMGNLFSELNARTKAR